MEHMFYECSALETLNLSSFDISKVTTMKYMFGNCYALKNLNLSSFNTSNVTTMAYMFDDCQKLTSLDLSSFNTSKVTTMVYMFCGCKDLETITVSGEWSAKNSSYDEAMFSGCSALKGGNGTEYNANYIGKERAIADLDNDHKGWLSYIML